MAACLLALVVTATSSVQAQKRIKDRGFETKVLAYATGEEISAQSELWIFEVDYKPMRLMRVEITDKKTGKKSSQLVWYLVYRVMNRPISRPDIEEDLKPVNEKEPAPGPPIFIPEFTLVADDNGVQRIYHDEILPEAQTAIISREVRSGGQTLKNSVEIIGPIPPLVSPKDPDQKPYYGVVTFRGVNPETDFFTVYMSGFSNGYKLGSGPNDKQVVQRKTLVQKYWRPGDQFEEREVEFRVKGDPYWIYRADDEPYTTDAKPAAAATEVKPAAKK